VLNIILFVLRCYKGKTSILIKKAFTKKSFAKSENNLKKAANLPRLTAKRTPRMKKN